MVSCLLTELFYIGMPVVWTDSQSGDGQVITKISRMHGLPNFPSMELHSIVHFARAIAPLLSIISIERLEGN